MKDRLYRKNVVEAKSKIEELTKQQKKSLYTDAVGTLLGFLICTATIVVLGVYISPLTGLITVPVAVRIFARRIVLLFYEKQTAEQLSLDYDNYSVFMEQQMQKDNPHKEKQLAAATEMYRKYSAKECTAQEICDKLNTILKSKEDNQFAVSVLCGLLFVSADKKYRDKVYSARYKSGSVGNMVLSAWIQYWDGDLPQDITFEKLKCEFEEYWNAKV